MRDFQLPGRSPARCSTAMAATSHPIATGTALKVLAGGGNAVDAAIAAALVLGLCEPHMTGIGGDMFAIIAEPDGTLHGVNGSGRAGSRADAAALRAAGNRTMPQRGGAPVTVPGAIAGFDLMASRFGTMGFDRLLQPAIDLAFRGHPVGDRVAFDWPEHAPMLAGDPGGRQHLLVDGKAPEAGAVMRYPALGETLKRIAEGGPSTFYSGAIAEEIVSTVSQAGGFLTLDDLAKAKADLVTPIEADYRGLTVAELPPNGQGVVALIILKLLERFDLGALDPCGAQRLHLEIEAARLAYGLRDRELADPDSMHCRAEALYDATFIDRLAERIDPARRAADLDLPPLPGSDTIYLAIADGEGRLVSLIHSIYGSFGSGLVTEKSGIVLQNRGGCFSLEEGHPNVIQPGKRPMHTIIPAMALKDGVPVMAFGVMGGAYQPCGHAHVISNMVDFGMDPQAALDAPRAFWDADGRTALETSLSDACVWGLETRGHAPVRVSAPLGGGQMI